MYKKDLKSIVLDKFQVNTNIDHRYSSFDYCYNYFNAATAEEIKEDKEKACLQLGFYLASWGNAKRIKLLITEECTLLYTIDILYNNS